MPEELCIGPATALDIPIERRFREGSAEVEQEDPRYENDGRPSDEHYSDLTPLTTKKMGGVAVKNA